MTRAPVRWPWFLCALALPTAARAEPWLHHLALRLEGGYGTVLSEYQRNSDPARFDGNVKGYCTAWQGTARLSVTLESPVALQFSVSSWFFPSATQDLGAVLLPTVGLLFEPPIGHVGRFILSINAGPAFTGELQRLGFDLGLGFEFPVSRSLSAGPSVRYGHVLQPERQQGAAERYPEDARFVTVGLSFALRAPPPGVTTDPWERPSPRPPELHSPLSADRDLDGVLDANDQCPQEPEGAIPDASRPGCPAPDTDGDGVVDPRDRCRTVAQGEHPDPTRTGCPDPDGDGDGVGDHRDQCPSASGGRTPDPTRPGCPEGDRDHDLVRDSQDRCPTEAETFNGRDDADGCPDGASDVVIEGSVLRVGSDPINFLPASERIVGRRSFQILETTAALLQQHPELQALEVQGHTDDVGPREQNLELSRRRAEAVRMHLLRLGVAPGRLVAQGYGPDRPLRANLTADGRAANRRVEFHITRHEGADLAP
ncbi:MAG: OmpA family protein [Deltaproteobacteria bacterium]|nr:OmpA family protein [Deltaproteobacteria bacterium]